MLIASLIIVVIALVFATAKLRMHPFLALLLAAFAMALAGGIAPKEAIGLINDGFGGTLGYIGIVIALGTIIGVILERSGAAIVMAEAIIRLLSDRFPNFTVSLIGYIVSIPVFCDSGYVILNSLKNALAKKTGISVVAMSVALATGLFATHNFVPPTPGPIAAAANLDIADSLGLVILVGLVVAAVTAVVGALWAGRYSKANDEELLEPDPISEAVGEEIEEPEPDMTHRPSTLASFMPIIAPIALICLGSVASLATRDAAPGMLASTLIFLGQPVVALAIGVIAAFGLIKGADRKDRFHQITVDGILLAAPIILITGAGGAFGNVLRATPLGDQLGTALAGLGLGLLVPFIIAAALKSAQGSSTVALVTASTLVAPLLPDLGLDSDMGRVLAVMAVGAGAMTVSHANDSFFWVVSQFSRMKVSTAYKAFTTATLLQGISAMVTIYLLGLILV
ncbi:MULTISPECIES: GntP family permease [unclassified Guyparkeria]|uniref:GntP family permease n=1 Tax=unclassified Guyparkeria TaxID=2626246 RepID=UPI00073369DD|nr:MULTISPECIES: GntP family permease [unclassified Guyparkeria]KTG16347.1 gluconate transporter [Guyparkeria sp. XI15]OAE85287.1 gluconate transporter [Guyparkeria sp. WRN-7]